MSAIASFLLQLVPNVLAAWLDRGLQQLYKAGLPTTKRAYLQELRNSLEDMPFLYRNISLATAEGFVDIDLAYLNKDKQSAGPAARTELTTFERLRNTKRAVFIGAAGIGKTTLFRFSALSTVLRNKSGFQLEPDEAVVPVYIPLKAIDNREPFPIARYITHRVSYFKGKRGLKRLVRLAQKSRLFLFLDGYDEIPIVGGPTHIIRELELLFAGDGSAFKDVSDHPVYGRFYGSFLGCRVWLSTRVEFLRANPVPFGRGTQFWSPGGIGSHRQALVERIFARYKQHPGSELAEILSSEVFMQQLRVAGDGDLDELSGNPLFLTVMCFVYVSDLIDHKRPEDVWGNGIDAVIKRCISALLVDIDESKARGLSEGERKALLSRRSAWSDQKRLFLEYLAATTLLENRAVISFDHLTSSARGFFSERAKLPHFREILRGLDDAKDGTVNIVLQLIFSGLLVHAYQEKGEFYYDYPHRRFKEVMAEVYLQELEGFNLLCHQLDRPHLFEFALAYARSTTRKLALLRSMAELAGGRERGYYAGALLDASLRADRTCFESTEVICQLYARMREDPWGKKLPAALIDLIVENAAPIGTAIVEDFGRALADGDLSLLRLTTPLVRRAAPDAARKQFSDYWIESRTAGDFEIEVLASSIELDEELGMLGMASLWRSATLHGDLLETDITQVLSLVFSRVHAGYEETVMKCIDKYFKWPTQRARDRLNIHGVRDRVVDFVLERRSRESRLQPFVWVEEEIVQVHVYEELESAVLASKERPPLVHTTSTFPR